MLVRTSVTDPITVAQLSGTELPLPGRVGMTLAPGKTGSGVHGWWARDLRADVDRLVDTYRTAQVVSLVEDHELHLLGIPDLVAAFEARGVAVRRIPFEDGGIPTYEQAMEAVGLVLDVASRGENVVIHCRGGLGRTGLVAACALVFNGTDATRAVRAVRAVRPGAIENVHQERFVYDFAAAVRTSTPMPADVRWPTDRSLRF